MIELTAQRQELQRPDQIDLAESGKQAQGGRSMRIWMLASLLFAVTGTGGDRRIEFSSQLFDRVIVTSPRFDPSTQFSSPSVPGG